MAKAKKKKELSLEEKLKQALVSVDEQPYEVPENWCWVTVGNTVDLYRGVSYKKNEGHSVKEENDCLVMRGGNILEGAIDVEADNIYVDKSLIKPEQYIRENDIVIVSSTGSTKVIGRAGISYANYEDVSFGAFLTLVRPKEQICKRYIDYYFQSQIYRERIRSLASGVNINNIKTECITNSPFPLPPLAEQRRIVEQIESLFIKLDEAKEKAQEALNGFDERKASMLNKAFKGELTVNWRQNNQLNIDSWSTKKFKDFCLLKRGYDLPTKERVSGKYPLVTSSGVNDYVSEFKVKGPGVVTGRSGSIGKVFLISDEYWPLNTTLYSEKLYDNVPEYVYYYLQTFDFKSYSSSTAVPTLNRNLFADVELLVPTVEEQIQIVKIIKKLLESEEYIKESISKVIGEIDIMKKTILAKAFRGELGTNNPDEENAVELLKSILATE